MKINLSKKNKIIVIILFVLVLGGTGGYLLWRINQDDTVAPTDSDASGCHYVCDGSWTDMNCDHGSPGCNCDEESVGSEASNGNLQCCKPFHQECDATCGDGSCNGSETLASCPADCARCGDNVCTSPKETLANCPGDCSVCGDDKCTGSETATTCAADCACKTLTWGNKPSGSYLPTEISKLSPITITNPNSTSTAITGITIKLNNTTLVKCTSGYEGHCLSVATNTAGKQVVTVKLFEGDTAMAVKDYTLSVALPGVSESCSATASFTVAEAPVTDCSAFVWTNKPSGSYLNTDMSKFSAITITNPNSSSATSTGITIKINNTALVDCSLQGGYCFSVTKGSSGAQVVTIQLFRGYSSISVKDYVLSATLPGNNISCKELATFTIASVVVPGEDPVEVPDTGIFDGVMGKIYLGTGFVFLGIITTQMSKFTYMFNTIGERNRVVLEEKKRKKEEDKRNRFERRFK